MTADQTDQDQTDGTDQTDAAGTDQDQGKPASRQARRDELARARAAALEVERDTLTARLDARDTREVERLAGAILAQGADLLALGGISLDDLRDAETGEVDPDEVAALAAALAETRPGLALPKQRGHRDWGHSRTSDVYNRGGPGIGSESTTWSDAFGSASNR